MASQRDIDAAASALTGAAAELITAANRLLSPAFPAPAPEPCKPPGMTALKIPL